MNVLVFGFSITEQGQGFVEQAKVLFSAEEDVTLSKVAIGGISPVDARYLLPTVLNRLQPDLLILEIASSYYRRYPRTVSITREHRETLLGIFRVCAERSISCGVLDLPRTDFDPTEDWLGELNGRICTEYGVARREVPLNTSLLKDYVHTNKDGALFYANVLKELITEVSQKPTVWKPAQLRYTFDAISVASALGVAAEVRPFSRAGLETNFVMLRPSKPVLIELQAPQWVTGMTFLMGPTAGKIRITMDETTVYVLPYDEHSYYERLGSYPLEPRKVQRIFLEQIDEKPDIVLLKGTGSDAPRLGGVGHIFIEPPVRDA
jgi:hypothetical protein